MYRIRQTKNQKAKKSLKKMKKIKNLNRFKRALSNFSSNVQPKNSEILTSMSKMSINKKLPQHSWHLKYLLKLLASQHKRIKK
jgi:hypothetical protein